VLVTVNSDGSFSIRANALAAAPAPSEQDEWKLPDEPGAEIRS
jgi:hypothetical protein